ncbi:MAG: glycerophosphodiester phosphodiesterase family protein, partial [Verrucomicrobiota bacterium]
TFKVKPNLKSILYTLRECDADGFSSNYRHLNLDFVKQVRDAGYEYHFWTVDDPKLARKFVSLGAKSITTNIPRLIKPLFPNKPSGD